jgi:hypothetical protein
MNRNAGFTLLKELSIKSQYFLFGRRVRNWRISFVVVE